MVTKNKPKESVFAEAWQKMTADMEKFLPRKLHGGKGRWILALFVTMIELLVLGAVGTFVYAWLKG